MPLRVLVDCDMVACYFSFWKVGVAGNCSTRDCNLWEDEKQEGKTLGKGNHE